MSTFIKNLILKFNHEVNNLKLSGNSYFILREDGVLIHHHGSSNLSFDPNSISALMAGAWQAASTLADQLEAEKKNSEEFRMSFDNSSCGVYILPVTIDEREYFLGTIYNNTVNPGALKSKLRTLAKKVADGSVVSTKGHRDTTDNTAKGEYLFKNISDDEISAIFSKVEG
jgi:predicted regulator of Ras-like GTPase activity (Roadblock/LC7/MglB family)